jgi:uncharacterized integral membrane protein
VGERAPSSPPTRGSQKDEGVPWKLVAFAALMGYAILIVLFNRDQVDISFVFFSATISLVVLILLCVGMGFAGGFLFSELRARRRRSLQKSAEQ